MIPPAPYTPASPPFSRKSWRAWSIMAVGLLLATAGGLHEYAQERQRINIAFEKSAYDYYKRFEHSILRDFESVHTVTGLFHAAGIVNRLTFRHFTTPILDRHPGLLSLQWLPRIRDEDRAMIESMVRADGYEDFVIKELAPDGLVQVAGTRSEYFPIFYREPDPGNESFLGLDLAAEPRRRAALELARDNGIMSVTERLPLAWDSEARYGVLVAKAVYQYGIIPDNVDERRSMHLGYVIGVVRIADAVSDSISVSDNGDLSTDILVFDADSPPGRQRLYPQESPYVYADQVKHPLRFTASFTVGGRNWQVVVIPALGAFQYITGGVALMWFLTTLAGTVLLAILVQGAHDRQCAQEKSNRAKSMFVAYISHELRTPLNTIMGFADMIALDAKRNAGKNKYHEYAHDILESARHLLSLIGDIIDLSKVEGGKIELQLEEFDLARLAHQIITTFEPLSRAKGNTLELQTIDSSIIVYSDPRKIRQIFINLLGNAIKFTRNGSITLTLRKIDQNGTPWVEFSIADTGEGIPLAFQEHIFQPYTQMDIRRASPFGGSGLGLAITREYCRLLGGQISLVAQERGTMFTIHLPCTLPSGTPG